MLLLPLRRTPRPHLHRPCTPRRQPLPALLAPPNNRLPQRRQQPPHGLRPHHHPSSLPHLRTPHPVVVVLPAPHALRNEIRHALTVTRVTPGNKRDVTSVTPLKMQKRGKEGVLNPRVPSFPPAGGRAPSPRGASSGRAVIGEERPRRALQRRQVEAAGRRRQRPG